MNSFWNNLISLFYKKKYINGRRITRILCFRFYKSIEEISFKKLEKVAFSFIPSGMKAGKNSYAAMDIKIATSKTSIGSFCSIGQKVVLGNGKHPLNFLSSSPYFYLTKVSWKNNNTPTHDEFLTAEPIYIGNDVWIGDEVYIKNGIKIGDGAVIGAKSIVTKDVPPYAIVAGCPAKIIRYRFNEETIKELLELKWWELDDEILKKVPYDNINKAITYLKEVKQ